MIQGLCKAAPLISIAILSVQFLQVPLLGDTDRAGKLFVFVAAVLLAAVLVLSRRSSLYVSRVGLFFVLLAVLFLLSATQAAVPSWALLQTLLFIGFTLYLFLSTDFSFRNPKLWSSLIDSLLFFGLLVALLGLYEYFHYYFLGPSGAPLIPYLLPPDLNKRIVGIYGQPNLTALLLVIVLLAYCFRYVHTGLNSASKLLNRLRYLPFLCVALVLFLTGSRAGFLSLALMVGFLAWLIASRRYLNHNAEGRKQFYSLLFCLGLAFAISRGLPALGVDTGVRALGQVGESTDARFVFWASAILIFLDNPWLGIGLDNFGFIQNRYNPAAHEFLGFVPYEAMQNTNYAHNELLQLLCEGGILAFAIAFFLVLLLLWKIWTQFVNNKKEFSPEFFYSHIFLLPFIIQAMFSWPLRSPPLLILFFTFLGILLSQYPLSRFQLTRVYRVIVTVFLVLGVVLTTITLNQELQIGEYKKNYIGNSNLESTLESFSSLVEHPYSSYRVLEKGLPGYTRAALLLDNASMAEAIIPYYEQLTELEGTRWQWYDLARLYLKVGREKDSADAIQKAINLMPSDDLSWAFQHYLHMLKASRETGRPLESFFPNGESIDFNVMELMHE